MGYLEDRAARKNGLLPKMVFAKPKKAIKKISDKKAAENAAAKEVGSDNSIDLFFERNRKRMVNVCQCGCARKSSKMEDEFYRCSICHIFPKRIFKSIADNDYNWVERNFWDGCHGNMDNRSMDKWVNYADWDDIKEKYFILAPLLTEDEKKTKFYKHITKLVYQ